MEARILKLALCATLSASLGASAALAASYRTQNFLVSAHSQRLAQEVAVAAERYRQRLAVDWLGQDLPPWTGSCPITVFAKPGLPAGGATSFGFHRGQPLGWTMQIQGSRERILDSVLPHEVLHTVFATHFGQPLPRWADEGACTTVEHRSEQTKQQDLLIRFLTTRPSRGIAFNQMFAMRDYPRDILPLYAQGYSVTKFLLARGGKRQFVEFVKTGLANQNWAGASSRYYEIRDLSDLQTTWLDWVRSGSPAPGFTRPAAGTDLVNPIPRDPFQADPTPSNGFPAGALAQAGKQHQLLATATSTAASRNPFAGSPAGWYARRAEAARLQRTQRSQRPSKTAAPAGN